MWLTVGNVDTRLADIWSMKMVLIPCINTAYMDNEFHKDIIYWHGTGLSLSLSWRDSPLVGLGLLIHEVCFFLDHTQRHITVGRTPLDE